jgi:hypothetical protein
MTTLHYFAPTSKTVYPRESIMDFLEYALIKVAPGTLEELIFEIDLLRFHAIDRECVTPTVLYYLKETMIKQRDSLKRLHIALFRTDDDSGEKKARDRMIKSDFLKPAFMTLAKEIGELGAATHVSLRGGIEPVLSCKTALIFRN